MRGYQLHLSRGDSLLKDRKGRSQKFKKILSILRDFHGSFDSLNGLDIGCSSGIITNLLGENLRTAIGIDIDQEAIQSAKRNASSPRTHFFVGDSMALPFHDQSIDVIVCNHIYEHVPEASRLMDEIYRVMKDGGFCYFSAGNRYMLVEGHYGLPFLSWVPKPLAHLYLRLFGKGTFYYEEHRSLRQLRKLVWRFRIHDYTLNVIRDPAKFCATDLLDPRSVLYRWMRLLAPALYRWIPTYLWVLTKR